MAQVKKLSHLLWGRSICIHGTNTHILILYRPQTSRWPAPLSALRFHRPGQAEIAGHSYAATSMCCGPKLWHIHHHRKRSWGGPIPPENHVKTPNPEGVHHHIGNIWELQLTRALHWGLFGGKLSLLAWPNSMMCQETNPALNGGFNGKIIYKW